MRVPGVEVAASSCTHSIEQRWHLEHLIGPVISSNNKSVTSYDLIWTHSIRTCCYLAQLFTLSLVSRLQTENLEEVALKAAALEKKNTKRSRVVVITQGSDPTIIAQGMFMFLRPSNLINCNLCACLLRCGKTKLLKQGQMCRGSYAPDVVDKSLIVHPDEMVCQRRLTELLHNL